MWGWARRTSLGRGDVRTKLARPLTQGHGYERESGRHGPYGPPWCDAPGPRADPSLPLVGAQKTQNPRNPGAAPYSGIIEDFEGSEDALAGRLASCPRGGLRRAEP